MSNTFERLTSHIYAIIHLQEIGEFSEGFAARLMNCDRVTYRVRREEMEAEMKRVLSADVDALRKEIVAKAEQTQLREDAL